MIRSVNGRGHDCETLAHWADDEAWDHVAQQITSIGDYVAEFGIFVPADNGMVLAAQAMGFNIAATGGGHMYLNNGTVPTGFDARFQDSSSLSGTGGNNNDQSHHFAAFLEFGYATGSSSLGAAAAFAYDVQHSNWGDIRLGAVAADLGARLKSGSLSPLDLGREIRRSLCAH